MRRRFATAFRSRAGFTTTRRTFWFVCLGSAILRADAPTQTAEPQAGPAEVVLCGKPAPPPTSSACGFTLIADSNGPQVALMSSPQMAVVSVQSNENVEIVAPVRGVKGPVTVRATMAVVKGANAGVGLAVNEKVQQLEVPAGQSGRLEISGEANDGDLVVRLKTVACSGNAAVRWQDVHVTAGPLSAILPIVPPAAKPTNGPLPEMPTMRPAIEQALIEWDWRMQDGIGTPRVPSTWSAAIERTLGRGDALIRDLIAAGVSLQPEMAAWEKLRSEWGSLRSAPGADDAKWEDLWRRLHGLRRRIALANPLADVGPLAFVKQAPGVFSHQLTQVYGRYARPGGGIFVLDRPGQEMRCRQLGAEALPTGSYQNLDVSYDGDRLLFAFCKVEAVPDGKRRPQGGPYYHLYEMSSKGSDLRQLTDGPYDDFAPRYLPNGKIVFVSTRRGGWHRCGNPGCENYTLALAEGDGANPRTVSYHETQEWDPAVLDDGRIVYTRWDYVDRHAVYYEQLWSVRPDGTGPTIFYGNKTFNPVGIWEARQVPGSRQVMATAGAHHAMTAGSIILVNVARGVDGPDPITRLTPDALFPESENKVAPGGWYAPAGVATPPAVPVDEQRWPGHCYRSPLPLSEKYFIAAYSFDSLIGEPKGNPANMFGLYLVDGFGNKELLYRDLNISSLWPAPIRARTRPPVLASPAETMVARDGTFFLQNVYASDPTIPKESVKRLRIIQVVPKSTPGANNPTVGLPNASPGKQVLGTVPVEPDGSAYFRAPAATPLSFQALDENGMAVQVMRSITYLQPGENASCVGCHESRLTAPPGQAVAKATSREPSTIQPAPDGSCPLSYPILVQPVLDKHCVKCHGGAKPDGGITLTGAPQGRYTYSYNALAPRVSFSTWGGRDGDFRKVNSEPISAPGFFGAKGAPLTRLLAKEHYGVRLTAEEMDRLVTWMDANALFYGTFDPADQARQLRGERIAGPGLR